MSKVTQQSSTTAVVA